MQEVKAQRPQAAVKGITPAQPAPKHEAKKVDSISFFGKLFAWLFGSGEKNKPVAVPAKARPQNPRRERDSNRGERPEGAQQQGNRQRNKPRRDREEANTNTPRTENNQQPKNQQQETRPERPPRPPRPANVEKPVLETVKPVAAANEQNVEEGGNQGRKRGRRGGRRERERRDQLVSVQPNGIENGLSEVATNEISTNVVSNSTVTEAPVSEVAFHNQAVTPNSNEPTTTIEPTFVAQNIDNEIVAAPVTITTEAVTIIPEPEVVKPVAEPTPVVTELPSPPSIAATLSEAGLVLIETDPNKAASTSPAPESREHAPRRRQRPREVYTAENSEPLVMIETQQHH
jgi:ribonuclease E